MVETTIFIAFYGLMVTLMLFVLKHYFDWRTKVSDLLVKYQEVIKGDDTAYAGVKMGLWWVNIKGIIFFLVCLFLVYNVIYAINTSKNSFSLLDALLVAVVLFSLGLTVAEDAININKQGEMAYKGNASEVFDKLVKGRR